MFAALRSEKYTCGLVDEFRHICDIQTMWANSEFADLFRYAALYLYATYKSVIYTRHYIRIGDKLDHRHRCGKPQFKNANGIAHDTF